jgi:hypothetical protein
MSFRDDISIVIPVSVIYSHPLTHTLDWTVASVRSHLFNAPIYLMMDGVRFEQEDRRVDYEQFKSRLTFPQWAGDVHKVEFSTHHHQAAMLRETLHKVSTPLVLFLEQDWMLLEPIPWDAMAAVLLDYQADVIRLHQTDEIHPEHEHLFLEHVDIMGVPLRKMRVFWAQPHLARTDWYRKVLAEKFSPNCRCFIEDRLYGINLETPWELNKIYMYEPEGKLKRVSHTDGRGKNPDGSPLVDKWESKQVF